MVFLCVFDTFTFLFAVVGLCVVLGTFLGLLWALLGPPWRSLGCLGVSLAALGGHFWTQLALFGVPWRFQGGLGWSLWAHFARPRPPMATILESYGSMLCSLASLRGSVAALGGPLATFLESYSSIPRGLFGGLQHASEIPDFLADLLCCFHEVLQSYSKDRGEFLRWVNPSPLTPQWHSGDCAGGSLQKSPGSNPVW